jgi:hypothetical protein
MFNSSPAQDFRFVRTPAGSLSLQEAQEHVTELRPRESCQPTSVPGSRRRGGADRLLPYGQFAQFMFDGDWPCPLLIGSGPRHEDPLTALELGLYAIW